MIERFLSFRGMLSRRELLYFLLGLFALQFAVGLALGLLHKLLDLSRETMEALSLVDGIAILVIVTSFAIRRFRDIGNNPLWTLALLVPYLNIAVAAYLIFQPGWQHKNGTRHLFRAMKVVADANGGAGPEEISRFQEILHHAFGLPSALQPAMVSEWTRSSRPPSEFQGHMQKFAAATGKRKDLHQEAMQMLVAIASSGGDVSPKRALLLDEAMDTLGVEPPLPPALDAILGMAARLSKADGRITEEHIEVIDNFLMNTLSLTPGNRSVAIKTFNAAKTSATTFDTFAEQFMSAYSDSEAARDSVFALLLNLALVDETISPSESELLDKAARLLRIEIDSFDSHKSWGDANDQSSPASTSHDDHYYRSVLGVGTDATWDDIRKAYRLAMAKNHPDKVAGLSKAIREVAEAESKRINEAYEYFESKYRRS